MLYRDRSVLRAIVLSGGLWLPVAAACTGEPPHAAPPVTIPAPGSVGARSSAIPAPPASGALPGADAPPAGLGRYLPGRAFRDLGDGRRVAVAANRRIVVSAGQARVVDAQPVEDLGRPRRIPEALGGGTLFVGEHTVRFASAFEAPLALVGTVATGAGELHVGLGYHRVLIGAGQAMPTLHELPSGTAVALAPPGVVEMFGTPRGLVAARDAGGALYVSASAGAPWTKLSAPAVSGLRYDGKGIVVDTDGATLRLDPAGKLAARPDEPGLTVASNLDALEEPFPDMSQPPPEPGDTERLLDPLTRSMTRELALRVHEPDLLLLDASSGTIKQTLAGALVRRQNCFIIRGGTPSFVGCNGDKLTLLRVDSPGAAPVVEREIKGVYTQDFGEPGPTAPLALAKRCDGSDHPGALCVREPGGRWRDLPAPADPQGLLPRVPFMVHVAASPDGSVYGFGWLDGGGDLVIVDGRQQRVRRVAKSAMPPWAGSGVDWLALEIEGGTLRFVLSNASHGPPSAGIVEIRADDSIHAEPLAGRVSAVGVRALQLTAEGKLRETVDGGRTFHEVAPPPGGLASAAGPFLRCVDTGCELGPWCRLGWDLPEPPRK
jgi:hypothetical protein